MEDNKKTKQVKKNSPSIKIPQGTWARTSTEKAQVFATYLANIFQLHATDNNPVEKNIIIRFLESPYQLELPNKRFKSREIQEIINSLNPKKSPGYDLISDKILKQLPTIGVKYLTQLFNAVLSLGYFPIQWKVAQIILIPKPGKPPNDLKSYRPINLFTHYILPAVEKTNQYPTSNLDSVKCILQQNGYIV